MTPSDTTLDWISAIPDDDYTVDRDDLRSTHQNYDEWLGVETKDYHLRIASERRPDDDWYSYQERIRIYRQVRNLHFKNLRAILAGKRRQPDLDHGIDLLIGDMGSGKSIWATHLLLPYYCRGIPVFHNGSCLFGRRIAQEELYTCIHRAPIGSVLWFDEIHTANESRMGMSTAQRVMEQSITELRKKKMRVLVGSAADTQIGFQIRSNAKNVWQPHRVKTIVSSQYEEEFSRPAHDPANFQFGVHLYNNYPYRGVPQLTKLYEKNAFRFRRPPQTFRMNPLFLQQMVFPLTDTFMTVPIGTTIMMSKTKVMDEFHGDGVAKKAGNSNDAGVILLAIYDAIVSDLLKHREWAKAGDIAGLIPPHLACTPAIVGSTIRQYVPGLDIRKHNGFNLVELKERLEQNIHYGEEE